MGTLKISDEGTVITQAHAAEPRMRSQLRLRKGSDRQATLLWPKALRWFSFSNHRNDLKLTFASYP